MNGGERIEVFLHEELKLDLNARQRLAPVSNGIDFLGYIVRRDYLLTRRRVVNHLKCRLRDYAAQLVSDSHGVRRYRFDETVLDQLAATLSSYLGHFKLANSWNLWQAIWQRYAFLSRYFDFDAENWRLVRKYTVPKGFRRVRQQYRYFRWRFPQDALLFQVGRFVEFYDVGESRIGKQLGLEPVRPNPRGARHGFPIQQTHRHVQRLLDAGFDVILIAESENRLGNIQQRVPVWRYEVCGGE